MLKSLLALPLLASSIGMQVNATHTDYLNDFVLTINERGNYTVTGVVESSKNKEELRVYYDENKVVDEIDSDAFVTCPNLTTLMFSYSITHIDNDALDNIVVVKYTGSEEQYNALGITKTFSSIYYYACDEGFINYWNTTIRPEKGTSICDISKETFNTLYSRYIQLTSEEKAVVDTTLDKAGAKIGDSMQELVNLFYKPNSSKPKSEWNQSGAITLIIVISVIGMTSICIFFLLKTKKLID